MVMMTMVSMLENSDDDNSDSYGKCGNGGNDDYEADDDIYNGEVCVCHVFAYFAFALPSWRYTYNGGVSVCLYVTSLSPARALFPLPEREKVSYTFDYKSLQFQHIMMIMIVMNIMIDWEEAIYIASELSWAPKARN